MKNGIIYEDKISFSNEQVMQFAEVTGDKNPIHIDSDFAAKSIYGKIIVHGTLIEATFSKNLMLQFPGTAVIIIKRESLFLRPVFVDETYIISCKINFFEDDSNTVNITNSLFTAEGKLCVRSKSTLKREQGIMISEIESDSNV
jgi:3-hydroxybutyryl-CoA dehydratase